MSAQKEWDKKREAFFASDPKCKECGRDLDHYSRTMLCRECQKIIYKKRAQAREPEQGREYRKKHKDKIQAYQENYYQKNRETISERKKQKYKKEKDLIKSARSMQWGKINGKGEKNDM